MGEPIRWLHLSDFHIGKDGFAEHRIFRQIYEHVREVTSNGFKLDLLFITGDIADKGNIAQYETFNNEFLEPLYETLGIEFLDRTYIVPGNHDLDRSILPGFDREFISSPTSHFFDANSEGEKLRVEQLFPRFKAFSDNISSRAPKHWLQSKHGAFTDIVKLNGKDIGIVGINSAWISKDLHDRHKLTPGVYLLEDALNSLPKCDGYIVLGHHPIDWFLDDETDTIRRILGQFNAIYLHGHLHKARTAPEDGAGRGFLNIQCGAAFQIRDRVKEPWVNGLLWCILDLDKRQLLLQPRNWDPENGWPITSNAFPHVRRLPGIDWWAYPLPPSEEEIAKTEPATLSRVSIPEGWQLFDQTSLDQRRRDLSESDMLRYFDGSIPDWSLALSPAIPKRLIVKDLLARLVQAPGKRKPQVTLLCGAGGEGKSTAFLQSIVELLRLGTQWSVIWRFDESKKFTPEKATALPISDHQWLIATDDADLIVDDIFSVVQALHVAERGDVHLFLACRDTDWIAAKGKLKEWTGIADYKEIYLSGLLPDDAQAIVNSWSQYGEKGLGRLSGKDTATAARLLIEAAVRGSATGDGAFFGAMLDVRLGADLKDHLKSLLLRLAEHHLPNGGSLLNAFAYIAVMHAEGLNFLSRPVLARVMGYDVKDVKRRLIAPLGKEAAATTSGDYIYTRHKTIAQASLELLSSTFSYDIEQLFIDLAAAAVTSQEFLPENLSSWRYILPDHFLENGQASLAVRIAQRICEEEPNNSFCFVHLGKTYRAAGSPELASKAFRIFRAEVKNDRGFYYEWGTAEGAADNQALSVWLDSFSLCDQSAGGIPTNDRAKKSLAGLGVGFGALYELYNAPLFNQARMAIAVLGLTLQLDFTTQEYFTRHKRDSQAAGIAPLSFEEALTTLKSATEVAWSYCPEKEAFSDRILSPSDMTFVGLKRLIENAARRS